MKRFTSSIIVTLTILLFSATANAQGLCSNNTTSVYFEKNSHKVDGKVKSTLDSLIEKSEGDLYVEVKGYCDSTGSDSFNDRLSKNRANNVSNYLTKKSKLNKKQVKVFSYGEKNPKYDNGTEEGRSKNRRADVLALPLEDGNVKIEGSRGSSVAVPLAAFQGESICDCAYKLDEITNDDEAEQNGVPMYTINDEFLSTEGMISLGKNDCIKFPTTDDCKVKVTIPSFEMNEETSVWVSIDTLGGLKWKASGIEIMIDEENGAYVLNIPCADWEKIDWLNCAFISDEEKFDSLSVPNIKRYRDMALDSAMIEGEFTSDTTVVIPGGQIKKGTRFTDIGKDEENNIYYIDELIENFMTEKNTYEVPLSAYKQVQYSDTLMMVKAKKNTDFVTVIPSLEIEVDNEIYQLDRKFFFDKIFFRERYLVKIPKREHSFTANGEEVNLNELEVEYKDSKDYLKTKKKIK